jgi:non-specific serine/threonine protein kinase
LFRIYFLKGRYVEAHHHNQEAQRCFSELNLLHGLNLALENQGELFISQKAYAEAEETFRQCLPLAERSGVRHKIAYACWRISQTQLYQNQFRGAVVSALRATRIYQVDDHQESPIGYSLLNLAAAIADQDLGQAARLHGKALSALQALGEELFPQDILPAEELLKRTRARLGERAYATAQAEGAALSLEALLAAVPDERDMRQPDLPLPPARPQSALRAEKARFAGLTAREREIAALITQGFSNRALAARLLLSERTVTTHITHILTKLGYTSRTQIAAWAVEKGLVSLSER